MSTTPDSQPPSRATQKLLWQQLSEMQARAEKAEAEVGRLQTPIGDDGCPACGMKTRCWHGPGGLWFNCDACGLALNHEQYRAACKVVNARLERKT